MRPVRSPSIDWPSRCLCGAPAAVFDGEERRYYCGVCLAIFKVGVDG